MTRLVRAFTAYFHLANITEQVHRGRALTRAREEEGGWIEQAVARIADAGIAPEEVGEILRQVGVRPVFTAHPTEVARRSTIDKLRRVAALLEEPDTPRRTRRLEEAIELLWLTDEIRVEPPDPTDEARNIVYYLEGLSAAALPDVLEELRDQLATIGVDLPPDVRPLRFGSWVGGDRDGNPHVTPATTREVLTLQAVHGIRLLRSLVDRVRRDLSVSSRVGAVSDELLRPTPIEQLPGLPEVEPRYRRLNAEEPYRLFLTCVHVRLGLTEQRLRRRRPARRRARLRRRHRAARRPPAAAPLGRSSTRARSWPAARSSAWSAPSPQPGSPWPPSTSASTRRSTTTRSGSCSTASVSSARRTPSSTGPLG